MRTHALLSVCLLAGMAALLAEEPRVSTPTYNRFSEDEELEIGRVMAEKLERELPIVDSSLLEGYLNGVAGKLGRVSQRPGLRYAVRVVNTSEVNAFSLPGGRIYISRGMLDFLEEESELAGILGHEVGHIAARHSLNLLALQLHARHLLDGIRGQVGLLREEHVEELFRKMGTPVVELAQLKYRRDLEAEADLLAFHAMARAGWSPVGWLRYFDRVRQGTVSPSLLETLRSTHPPSLDRARAIRNELRDAPHAARLEDNSLSFRTMKMGLRLLPAPTRAAR